MEPVSVDIFYFFLMENVQGIVGFAVKTVRDIITDMWTPRHRHSDPGARRFVLVGKSGEFW